MVGGEIGVLGGHGGGGADKWWGGEGRGGVQSKKTNANLGVSVWWSEAEKMSQEYQAVEFTPS